VLLGKHERGLSAFVASLVPHWSDADEIVQETRIRLWEQFDEYDETRDFGAWARTIAHYFVLAHRKKMGRESNRLDDDVIEQIAATAATEIAQVNPRRDALKECLEEMQADQRELLQRCYGGGESIRQVAEEIDRSFGSVRQSLYRLRSSLFDCVERKVDREERP